MYPVLLTIGPLSISSFGFSMALAFLAVIFILWRLAKVYDLNEEKILDLVIITFFGGLIGARLYFVATHWALFGDLNKVLLINRYPGLSFWGGLVGGILVLRLLTARAKLNFWQLADFAAAGLLLGIAIGDLGCFFGGCAYGKISNSFLAAPVVGLIGRRFPVSALESLLILIVFANLWKQVVKFHFNGKIAAYFLISLGTIKFITEFFRGDNRYLTQYNLISEGQVFSLILIISGVYIFYRKSKRSLTADLVGLKMIFASSKKRSVWLLKLRKNWYNHSVSFRVKMRRSLSLVNTLPKKLKRRLNVKSTPTHFS